MTSLYLRLAGPYQSWAGPRVTGNYVYTSPFPTRSGVLGLLAASLGAGVGEYPDWLYHTDIDIRIDNPGRIEKDFQTINPKPETQLFRERIWVASGLSRRPPISFTPDQEKGTSIVRRTYIAGGEFYARVSHETQMSTLIEAMYSPKFSPYLGRKAFAPTFPFLLGLSDDSLLEVAPSLSGGSKLHHNLAYRATGTTPRVLEVVEASRSQVLAWWRDQTTIPEVAR